MTNQNKIEKITAEAIGLRARLNYEFFPESLREEDLEATPSISAPVSVLAEYAWTFEFLLAQLAAREKELAERTNLICAQAEAITAGERLAAAFLELRQQLAARDRELEEAREEKEGTRG
jgi:hypothetical protein